MAYGDGFIWSGANGGSERDHPDPPINGIFQTDMNSKQISQRQIPFGPKNDGGSCHGLGWQNGKLWLYANRMESIIRIDAKSWETDIIWPTTRAIGRLHGIEFTMENGKPIVWQTCGTQEPGKPGYDGYTPGLVKYDAMTGKVLQIVDFVPAPAICTMSRCGMESFTASTRASIPAGRSRRNTPAQVFRNSTAPVPAMCSRST